MGKKGGGGGQEKKEISLKKILSSQKIHLWDPRRGLRNE